MDQAPTGRDHDPSKKGEHLEDPMMVTMDAKARAAQEAELKAMFAGARSARSEATEATPEAKDEGAAEAKERDRARNVRVQCIFALPTTKASGRGERGSTAPQQQCSSRRRARSREAPATPTASPRRPTARS